MEGPKAKPLSRLARLAARLDAFNEFEREPIAPDKLQGGRHFAAIFGGEHVAGTEFVIGSFFVLHGVSARDLLLGLIAGNILAVLSWTFICAPIATRVRLTLYWYLRRIGGPGLGVVYSVANALLFCFLAGAMIALCADAVCTGIEIFLENLDIQFAHPTLADKVPTSAGWVLMVLICGGLVTTLAILGFERMAKFASTCVPWMFLIFIAGALAMLPSLGFKDFGDLWSVAEKIWNGQPKGGKEHFTFWHVASFAWFCNLCTHIDLSDMALFRYARHWSYGLYSAIGMFLGHFVAWICSGVMCAAFIGEEVKNPTLLIGRMSYEAAGVAGILCVLFASWTTANPTLYRAGLALQIATPSWPRWKVTLVAGIVTSIAACFPFFVMQLLDFVALFGLVLMPVGAIVFAEHWLFPRLGLTQYWTDRKGLLVNPAAAITWIASLLFCFLFLSRALGVHLFFLWLPGYLMALILYIGLSALLGARGILPGASAAEKVALAMAAEAPKRVPAGIPARFPLWRKCAAAVAVASLASIATAALCRLLGRADPGAFYAWVNVSTVFWFVAGPLWLTPGLFGIACKPIARVP